MLALFASAPSYVNHFPAHDNPYNISLPADRDASFAFLLGRRAQFLRAGGARA